jgi:dolichol-phosphate mannosyltransferase
MVRKACIVLPTYNEVQNIPILIPLIFEEARKIETHEVHVLIVDDNSPDGTQEAVRSHMEKSPTFISLPEKRKVSERLIKEGSTMP